MTESNAPHAAATERAFLDANVIRGQLTNDILLSVAAQDVFEPRWSQDVIDEMRRNRPEGVSEQAIDRAHRPDEQVLSASPDQRVRRPDSADAGRPEGPACSGRGRTQQMRRPCH
jgi:hypothetical protein